MSDPVDRLGDKRGTRGFRPGVSGNPGGKVSLRKDLERAGAIWKGSDDPGVAELAGLTPEDARARWWAMILPVAFAGPRGPKDSNWTYAASEVGNRLLGKAKESIEISGGITPEAQALLEALRMTPHERRQLAAQDTTAAEDEAAELPTDDDSLGG